MPVLLMSKPSRQAHAILESDDVGRFQQPSSRKYSWTRYRTFAGGPLSKRWPALFQMSGMSHVFIIARGTFVDPPQ